MLFNFSIQTKHFITKIYGVFGWGNSRGWFIYLENLEIYGVFDSFIRQELTNLTAQSCSMGLEIYGVFDVNIVKSSLKKFC